VPPLTVTADEGLHWISQVFEVVRRRCASEVGAPSVTVIRVAATRSLITGLP
jgi:hypothetical protein